jgi:FixJ family two-component response regulator
MFMAGAGWTNLIPGDECYQDQGRTCGRPRHGLSVYRPRCPRATASTDSTPVVYVVDDDPSIRNALGRVFRSAGLRMEAFASAEEFLDYARADAPSCLVLDVEMPGMDGLGLQDTLNAAHASLPIIFITGHGDIRQTVRAMKAGAVDFFSKPLDIQDLLSAVQQAIARDLQARRGRGEVSVIQHRAETLTPREREVLTLVVSGLLNKQIGHRLDVGEKTVKFHRGQVMRKMKAGSLVELVRMAERIGIPGPARLPQSLQRV